MENLVKKTVIRLPEDAEAFYEAYAKRKGIKPNAIKIMALVQFARDNKIED